MRNLEMILKVISICIFAVIISAEAAVEDKTNNSKTTNKAETSKTEESSDLSESNAYNGSKEKNDDDVDMGSSFSSMDFSAFLKEMNENASSDDENEKDEL